MHFFIRRQTNGRTWRGRANQNPMRQQRPPIKRSLLKPPVTNPRSCSAVGRFDIVWPYAPCVYFEYTYLYAGFARSRSAFVSTSIVPERHGPVLPFLPPLTGRLPDRLKYETRWQLKSAGSLYNAVGLQATPRERKPVNWKRGDRVTGSPELPPRAASALSLRIPWQPGVSSFLAESSPFPFPSRSTRSLPRCAIRKKSLDSLREPWLATACNNHRWMTQLTFTDVQLFLH